LITAQPVENITLFALHNIRHLYFKRRRPVAAFILSTLASALKSPLRPPPQANCWYCIIETYQHGIFELCPKLLSLNLPPKSMHNSFAHHVIIQCTISTKILIRVKRHAVTTYKIPTLISPRTKRTDIYNTANHRVLYSYTAKHTHFPIACVGSYIEQSIQTRLLLTWLHFWMVVFPVCWYSSVSSAHTSKCLYSLHSAKIFLCSGFNIMQIKIICKCISISAHYLIVFLSWFKIFPKISSPSTKRVEFTKPSRWNIWQKRHKHIYILFNTDLFYSIQTAAANSFSSSCK
jgi:hypothetical protein